MKRPCHFCGDPVETDARTTFRAISGWEQHRTGGGANQITLRREHERFAHPWCIDKEKRGVSALQGSLI